MCETTPSPPATYPAMQRLIEQSYRLTRRLLFLLPPEAAHAIALQSLKAAHRLHLLPPLPAVSAPVALMGLRFPNRLGLAAGFDKNGAYIDALGALGFGFIEVGTVTLRPQSGNVRPRLFRLREDRALINRMGFPNDGAAIVCERLARRRYRGVCGVNIGKNAATSLDDAANDYVECLRTVHRHADYVAVNISSPNTLELRSLQQKARLSALLTALLESRALLAREHGRCAPLLVKLTADFGEDELASAARTALECGVDGLILVNTTVRREGLRSARQGEVGGLSGVPLFEKAKRAVQCVRAEVGASIPIIGVGGIASADDAALLRAAGADLIQIYTGLVYRGPALTREISRDSAIV